MQIPYFQVDAFTSRQFSGNPAGVCLLQDWLPHNLLQQIAMENNLSETAFLVALAHGWDLRWFTPATEVDLCGHATLAAAFVIYSFLGYAGSEVRFQSRSGPLSVGRESDLLLLDFPRRPGAATSTPEILLLGLGQRPQEVYKARDYMAVFSTEDEVAGLQPDMLQLAKVDALGVIATAPGKKCDFISRFFAPRAGVPEDPVTGSAHCTLIPYWSKRLGKPKLHGLQISKRGGELFCEDRGERVLIGGQAVLHQRGEIEVSQLKQF